MFKILRVNMTELSTSSEEISTDYQGLGGRGLTSAVINKEVDPICSPIGPNNKLVFAPGLLGGTNCANSGRISVGGKSPLTGGIKEANSGGQAGAYLSKLGIAAIIIEGMPKENKLYKLLIGKDKCKIEEADELKGMGNYATVEKLKDEYGLDMGYVSIGPAGEWKMPSASVAFTDRELRPTRHAGRGGLGAVMGSKGLKAIIIDPEGGNWRRWWIKKLSRRPPNALQKPSWNIRSPAKGCPITVPIF